MKMLVDASKLANCKVLFAGAGISFGEFTAITDYCKNMEDITFTGKFNYPKDISGLYGSVDCVYSVYDADNPNVCIALPNKLYESIYCGLPIIVSKGTYLSEIVNNWGGGISVSHNNVDELVGVLKDLQSNKDTYLNISKKCMDCKQRIFAIDYNKLLEKQFLKGISVNK